MITKNTQTQQSPIDTDLTMAMLLAIKPVALEKSRMLAIKADIKKKIRSANVVRPISVIDAGSGWQPFAPLVEKKLLTDNENGYSFLLRMHAGASLPEHDHDGDEECVVLQGDVRFGDLAFTAGDFHIARRGSAHGKVSTQGGVVMYIRASAADAHQYRA